MAYRKKTRARTTSRRRSGSTRSYRKAGSARRYSTRRKAPARKRYRKTVKPQTIRIELVQSAGSNLSPLEQQLAKQREATVPKKARF